MFAISDHPRNLKDERIMAMAQTGGAIGLCFIKEYLRRGAMNNNDATIDDLARQIDYIADLTGSVDHIFIGSDVDGGRRYHNRFVNYLDNHSDNRSVGEPAEFHKDLTDIPI